MDDLTAHDLNRLFEAIRTVRQTAVVESAAMKQLLTDPSEPTIEAVHVAHLAELDAVQALGAAMELLSRRHPCFMDALGAVAGTQGTGPAARGVSKED